MVIGTSRGSLGQTLARTKSPGWGAGANLELLETPRWEEKLLCPSATRSSSRETRWPRAKQASRQEAEGGSPHALPMPPAAPGACAGPVSGFACRQDLEESRSFVLAVLSEGLSRRPAADGGFPGSVPELRARPRVPSGGDIFIPGRESMDLQEKYGFGVQFPPDTFAQILPFPVWTFAPEIF